MSKMLKMQLQRRERGVWEEQDGNEEPTGENPGVECRNLDATRPVNPQTFGIRKTVAELTEAFTLGRIE